MFERPIGLTQPAFAPDRRGRPEEPKDKKKHAPWNRKNRIERRKDKSRAAFEKRSGERQSQKPRTLFSEAQSRLDKMRSILQTTFTREAGIMQVTISRTREIVEETGSAKVQLNIVGVICKKGTNVQGLVDQFANQLKQDLSHAFGNAHVRVFYDFTPENVLEVPEDKVSEYANLKQIVESEGRSMVLVAPEKGGRKSQMEITESRAPLRAQRLRMLQSLLRALPAIALSDLPDSMSAEEKALALKDESRIKTMALANAISIRGTQALYTTRDKIYSARKAVLTSPESENDAQENSPEKSEAQKVREKYQEAIVAFDRALERTAEALGEARSPEDTPKTAALFAQLADTDFNISALRSELSEPELKAAEEILESLRTQLAEYAREVFDKQSVPRGSNKIKTMLGYIQAQNLGSRLLDASLRAARDGGRYTPDIVAQAQGETNSALIPSVETLKDIEDMSSKLNEFRRAANALEYDVHGLRAALRLGYWKDTTLAPSRSGKPDSTLRTILDSSESELPKLKTDIENWARSMNIAEKAEKSGADGRAYDNFAREASELVLNTELMQDDLSGLRQAIADPEILDAVNTLAAISAELRAFLNVSDADPENTTSEMRSKVETLLYSIYESIHNEEWPLVIKLAKIIPAELGA